METTIRILAATIAATSAMTFFSYLLSWSFKKHFKEPALLELVFERLFNIKNPQLKLVIAWLFHYSVGLLFVVSYEILWLRTTLEPDWKSGLLFGSVCSVIAIASWSILLKIPRELPKLNRLEYYGQLTIAHFIFSFTAVGVYRIM